MAMHGLQARGFGDMTAPMFAWRAGTDKCIRYLNTGDRKKSYVVCGHLKAGHGVAQGPDVRYTHKTVGEAVVVSEEVVHSHGARPAAQANSVAEDRAYRRQQAQGHRDCVLSLALANISTGPVLLAAGRDGIIKAWR